MNHEEDFPFCLCLNAARCFAFGLTLPKNILDGELFSGVVDGDERRLSISFLNICTVSRSLLFSLFSFAVFVRRRF